MISVLFPWEIIINKRSKELRYFCSLNMFIIDLNVNA